jgi:hypothetical protein
MKITNRRRFPDWTDMAFTALPPGWINVYKKADGTFDTEPCPGVLTQQATTYDEYWNEEHDDGRVIGREKADCELGRRQIRTMFATYECGTLFPVQEIDDNYHLTTTAEQWAIWQAEKQSAEQSEPCPTTIPT